MNSVISFLQSSLSNVGPFFLLLGLLIFVHELGHFLVAKYFKVRVEVFSLGFGKKILSFKRGDTTYCLSIIPLGGYVKMYGDDPTAEIPASEKPFSFLHKPIGQRFWIVLAGPLMNFVFAVFLLFCVGLIGEHVPGGEIGDVAAGTAAAQAGFQSGDKIVKINGEPVSLWSEIHEKIEYSANQSLKIQVQRGSTATDVLVTPQLGENDSILSVREKVGRIEGLTAESLAAVVGIKDPQGPAAVAGVNNLDHIVAINGEEVHFFRDLDSQLKLALQKNQPLRLKLESALAVDDNKPPQQREAVIPAVKLQSQQSALEALGLESSELYLAKINKGSPAEKAGFMAGDKVVSLNGKPIQKWQDVIDLVSSYHAGLPALQFQVARSGKTMDLNVAPEMTSVMSAKGKEEHRQTIGVRPALLVTTAAPIFHRAGNPLAALLQGFNRSLELTQMVVMSLVRLVQNQVSARNIGGVISIGRFASQSFEMGLVAFLKMMALISINLFLLNLLPVPILDGGHLMFFTIEAIKGAPLGLKKMEFAQQVGIILLFSLMAFAIFNDISNLVHPPW